MFGVCSVHTILFDRCAQYCVQCCLVWPALEGVDITGLQLLLADEGVEASEQKATRIFTNQ